MKKVNLFLFILVANIFVGESCGFVIDTSGNFTLGDDLVETGTDAIIIQANNVDLNLDGFIVAGGFTGVKVKAGLSNIRIRNGIISQIFGSGISVGENCVGVQITDLSIAQCGGRSIELLGTDASNKVKNVLIDKVATNACCTSITSSQVILVKHVNNVAIRNSTILSSGNSSNDIEVIRLENSQECLVQNVLQKNNFGGGLVGCKIDGTTASFLTAFDISSGLALSRTFTGISLSNESSQNAFGFCRITSCTSNSADAVGLEVVDGAHSNIMREVNMASLEGENAYGFYIAGVGTPSNTFDNLFADCAIASFNARSGDAIGMLISRADDSAVGMCRFVNHRAPNGVAAGILFESGTGGDDWVMVDNRLVRNIGSSDANSFGVNMATGNRNIFFLNRASNNGQTGGNQFTGVQAGSVSGVAPGTINTVTAAWTNLGVTS